MLGFSRTSPASRVGVHVVVAAAFAAGVHAVWLRPISASIAGHLRALETIRIESSRGTSAERRLPALQRHVGRLQARLAAMRAAAPAGVDAAGVLRLLQARAAESGLSITAFKPSPAAAGESLAEWTVSMDFEGTYGSLVEFLGLLADEDVLLTAASLRMRAHDQPTDGVTIAGSMKVTVSVPAPLGPAGAPAPRPTVRGDGSPSIEGCMEDVVDGGEAGRRPCAAPAVQEPDEALP